MDSELQNKLGALKRYAATAGGSALTIMAVLQLLSPEQVMELKAQAEIANQSIFTLYGALTKMWIIAGPVAIGIAVKLGWNSSGVQALAGKLLGIAKHDTTPAAVEAQKAIVQATSTIAQDNSLPSSQDAKDTLVAATIALDEVQTIVTDAVTAARSPSESVVAAAKVA